MRKLMTSPPPRAHTMLLCALFCLSALGACKRPVRRDATPLDTQPPIVAADARAQERYDAGLDLLEAGKWAQSRQAFEAVQQDFPADPIASLATLYAARAELQDIRLTPALSSSASPDQIARAKRALADLSGTRRLDDRVRFVALLYLAITHTLEGRIASAHKLLEDYPGASLGRAVLPVDRLPAALILAGALDHAGRDEDALEAMALLHELALQKIDAQATTTPGAGEVSQQLTLYARGRGFALAMHKISEQDLQMRFLLSEDPFLRAAAGWALLQRRANDDLTDETRAALTDIYERSASAMTDIGALEAAAEMSALMATLGQQRQLVIGALVPLSGSARPVGQRLMRGMLLAQQSFGLPDDARITLVFRDSAEPAEQNFEFFAQLGALGVVGPIQQKYLAAASAQAARTHIPLMALTTEALTAPTGPDAQDSWIFRNFLNANAEAIAQANITRDDYPDAKVVVLYPDMAYGQQMAKIFSDTLVARGSAPPELIPYDRGATDYGKVAKRVARAKPGVIFVPESGGKVAEVVTFLARENIWGAPKAMKLASSEDKGRNFVRYLGTSLWLEQLLLEQANQYVQGAILPAWYSSAFAQGPGKDFTAHYRAVYGGEPSLYEAFSYDSVSWLKQVILDEGMRRPQSVRDALLSREREGATGKARFVKGGEAERELRFVGVDGRGFVPLKKTQAVRASELATPLEP